MYMRARSNGVVTAPSCAVLLMCHICIAHTLGWFSTVRKWVYPFAIRKNKHKITKHVITGQKVFLKGVS